MSESTFNIGQVCELLDIDSHTLRYWEKVLDLDIKRDNLSNRSYANNDLDKLKTIKYLRNEKHLNYKDIKKSIIETYYHDNNKEFSSLVSNDTMNNFMKVLTVSIENRISSVEIIKYL